MLLWEATDGSQPFVRAAPRARYPFPTLPASGRGQEVAPQGVVHGKENHWLFEAAGAGGFRKPVAADRARAWSARSQHHGILQVLQRADPEARERRADSGRHHRLRRPLLLIRDEDAAGLLLS